jgi:hypothetical protein
MTHTIHNIPTQTLTNITMVGRTVTYQGEQFKCYSVEGYDYYAFQSSTGGGVTADFQMPSAEWKREGWAFLLPMGAKIGDGFGIEVPLSAIKRGVSLAKRAI